ncbi:hypothetical protein L249_6292 [Ophiocordyceps polyrhachis-furcata BCC 54312]|uniref:Secreted protein n=1 Tax=Ophiocordyceps polyrhachis-furcata BCC 54312 TaxID=1330021 RepID=A0A367L130_9HYPO|nr:hypothetical protein L249_6292 [Ophiocordyceps polyrhachis-furcata BCC 54312]
MIMALASLSVVLSAAHFGYCYKEEERSYRLLPPSSSSLTPRHHHHHHHHHHYLVPIQGSGCEPSHSVRARAMAASQRGRHRL